MHAAEGTPPRRPGRLHRARALYAEVSKRKVLWLLVKDTFDACMEYRVTGLAAEAAFFVLMSLPPLLLGLVGALGYLDTALGAHTIDHIRQNILTASGTVLSGKGVNQLVRPLVDTVFRRGRPDIISVGFVIALWSGSRAVNVFVDTITIMYGLEGRRGIIRTRLLSFGLYVVALVVGAVVLPLLVAGPDAVVNWIPHSAGTVRVLYWPVVLVLSIAFLTTLYHVSVPVRSPWLEDVPGALVALLMWVLGSFLLRIYLTHTVEGPTLYGSLAAPVAVLLWIGVSAFAVLVGAAVNAAVDRVWPSLATATAREERARANEAAAAEVVARAAARRAGRRYGETAGESDDEDEDDEEGEDDGSDTGDDGEPPSEFPERWADFLPPDDVRSRLRKHHEPGGQGKRRLERDEGKHRGNGDSRDSRDGGAPPGDKSVDGDEDDQ
ncbi:YihY/virulence factor BrkB family protein [Streptomyces sp. PTM05]|uniref:YihY/virulence factor BrkB family protein n=1 Tax=Streptantibioticus parmotrematis TaxID=2873249 RepID=A0ABS7QRG8_9ACTN|nr:YihY/virulence factor BrkB family protein [Streptantibioticus parmotrematis]MBY8885786.1 YihY/virulence factor BrkB family protein [Streptantibioticus parmotrematis]